ncbi:MAG: hypothetical protein ACREFN_18695 [Acetobacteraceae bacterium]
MLGRGRAPGRAGIVDEDVDPAMGRQDLGNDPPRRFRVGRLYTRYRIITVTNTCAKWLAPAAFPVASPFRAPR